MCVVGVFWRDWDRICMLDELGVTESVVVLMTTMQVLVSEKLVLVMLAMSRYLEGKVDLVSALPVSDEVPRQVVVDGCPPAASAWMVS